MSRVNRIKKVFVFLYTSLHRIILRPLLNETYNHPIKKKKKNTESLLLFESMNIYESEFLL